MKKNAPHPLASLTEPRALQILFISLVLIYVSLFLLLPLITVFYEAFRSGLVTYVSSLVEEYALAAILLTLQVVLWVVPINTLFGMAAAWAITKFDFFGKGFLVSLIDLPFAVSPVVAGLIFVQLFGRQGWFGEWVNAHGLQIIFHFPGIVLATLFVTFPFVVRELIPLMQEQGMAEEEAALVLGASGWQTFWRVTLPNIKWGLIYGIILLNARTIGEFGAVSVVSGHIRGQTNTLPLHVEILYNEYQFVGAFAVASLLAFFTLATIGVKHWLKKESPR